MSDFSGDFDMYFKWLEAAGRASDTRRVRRTYLTALADYAEPRALLALTTDDLVMFLASGDWSIATRRVVRSAMRSFYGWATMTERISVDPSLALPPVHVPRGRPRPTPDSVWARALATEDGRVRLMVMLAGLAGLRRAEIARLHTRDVIDGATLRIRGKAGVVREIPLHPDLAEALAAVPEGYVFPGKRGHMHINRVGILISNHLSSGWTAHSCRHRFASRAYAAQRDLLAVQTLLGHASVATTQIYAQVPPDALMAGVLAAG